VKRIEALRVIDEVYSDRPLVITCGATARELAHVGVRDNHLYLLDSMGAAGAVGLGLALAGRGPLAAIEGDGSLLMGASMLPSIAYLRPAGYVLIVLDNHVHASADSFPTQAARVSLAVMGRGAGLSTIECGDGDDLRTLVREARDASTKEPVVLVAEIEPGNEPGAALVLDDPVSIKNRFVRALEAMS
jgi:thiamine pyrophosphate-dependent acetolactate synthase large subunit-like protein